ncbi:MAG: NAD-dependent epimerase/dehydratase family protein [Solirubrobacterales bacterium]
MAGGRRILIAGIGTHWGTELALRLERDPEVEQVLGIDTTPPLAQLQRTEFLEADIRSPLLARLVPATEADTLVHAGILWYPEPGKPKRALHDINVIGTLQLLAACERSPTLERVVLRGSAAIYGCEPTGPSFFTESMAADFPLRTRFQRDIGELEGYFANFARRHSRLTCCMLRYQPEIGPGLDSPIARYLSLPVVPTQLGFDPRLQLLHADDATAALHAAAMNPIRGAVNVAPSGSISLSRALRLIDRPQMPIPHPLFAPAMARLGDRLGAGSLYGDAVRLLRYGRGVDNSRLRTELGFEPVYDAVAAIRDFAAADHGLRLVSMPGIGSALDRLAGISR